MKLEHKNYQINMFTNNTDISINPTTISSFLNTLGKFGLIPTYSQEFNGLTGEKKQILVMTNPEQTFKIDFPTHAVIITGTNMEGVEFVEKSYSIMNELEKLLPHKRANRLAVISSNIYSGSKDDYQSIYERMFTYKEAVPFEWENRIAQKIKSAEIDVEINNVSTVRRCGILSPFINSGQQIDSISFENDINTVQEETSLRYDWKKSIEILKKLYSENEKEFRKVKRYIK